MLDQRIDSLLVALFVASVFTNTIIKGVRPADEGHRGDDRPISSRNQHDLLDRDEIENW